MRIVSTNPLVFHDVQRMCEEKYGSDEQFAETVLVLGYNVATFTPADLRKQYPGHRIIAYQLEQLFDGSKWANDYSYKWLRDCDEIWEYDHANLDWCASKGIKSVYRPMCYCECMKDIPLMDKDIDVLFYGYPTPRRTAILEHWMGASWDKYVTINATGVTGAMLKELLGRAKVVLNLHSFVKGCRQEQVRMFYPVINGICVVSEKSPYNEFGKAIIETDADHVTDVLSAVLSSGDWEKIGKSAPDVYREHCESRR